jgi:methylenetetrahydrofolate dehydrogenase (NADP+)/methenyltetrahydrofolate cyclohydrolase
MSATGETPRLLDGTATASEIRAEVAAGCAALAREHGVVPGLTVVVVGDDAASQIYVRNKAKAATAAGMRSEVVRLAAATTEAELLARIDALNRDPGTHGILVQLPLPEQIREPRVVEAVAPSTDVDGFHPDNVGRLLSGLPGFVPCTPSGVIDMLERHGIPLAGRHAVVIGRSNIVGKPMAVLLLRAHCTVTICHSRTRDLPALAAQGEILVVAAGRPAMITAEYIRPGAVVVDVGIHRVEDEARCREYYGDDPARLAAVRGKGGTLVGDVHPLGARGRAGWLSPVPGGVGPLTIACLLRNTLEAARRSLGARAAD